MSAELLHNESAQSLLSLSIAAAIAEPIHIIPNTHETNNEIEGQMPDMGGSLGGVSASLGSTKATSSVHKHRRLSSIGQSKKRISDVREATTRPSPAALQTAASALSSLASLSLSTSSPTAYGMLRDEESFDQIPDLKAEVKLDEMGISVSTTKTGKKRGTIFKCESCSKVYRHPSCLIKHRWEHSPHWREASKFLLSKHQQVQLLEAAAILSHLSPAASGGTSLPDDRALWPSYLSGGTLPLPTSSDAATGTHVTENVSQPTSSSVPTPSPMSRASSSGPRVHDYALEDSISVTHLRPGVLGVTTNSKQTYIPLIPGSSPLPVPRNATSGSNPWGGSSTSTLYSAASFTRSDEGMGGWSLPKSSIRSGSSSLPSDDEDEQEFRSSEDLVEPAPTYGITSGTYNMKQEVWDGMDMDMEL